MATNPFTGCLGRAGSFAPTGMILTVAPLADRD